MKWDCGPTHEENVAQRAEWHSWFAWYPVRVGPRDCRWLERVERRSKWWGGYEYSEGGGFINEYRAPQ